MRHALLLLLAAVAVGGSVFGCGGDGEAPQQASPPPTQSGPSAKTAPADGRDSSPGATAPAPAAKPEELRRYVERASRRCTDARASNRPPRLPDRRRNLPRFAQRALPLVQRTVRELRRLRPPRAQEPALEALLGAYVGLMPLLEQLAAAPPSGDDPRVQQAAELLPAALARVQAQAAAARLVACGAPVG